MSQDQQRESWSNHCEFFLSSLGLAVGLGKIEIHSKYVYSSPKLLSAILKLAIPKFQFIEMAEELQKKL